MSDEEITICPSCGSWLTLTAASDNVDWDLTGQFYLLCESCGWNDLRSLDQPLKELRDVIERARDLGPLMNFTSPLTPKEMIAAVVQIPESELSVAARHELVRLVELEEARVYRDGFSGEWKVWQELTLEQTEKNVDSRRWLRQWVADFQNGTNQD